MDENCKAAPQLDLLRVYTASLDEFHASIAKNTAHKVAEEDILVNLDADNFLNADDVPVIIRHFATGWSAAHMEEGQRDGTCGRIACRRKDFIALNGCDEDALPFG